MRGRTLKRPVTVTRGSLLYAFVVLLLVNATISGVSLWYMAYLRDQADKRWCETFALLDDPMSGQEIQDPVQRERSRRFQETIHNLREQHGCI